MGTKPGTVMERPVTKGTCRHHWLIEPPSGPISKGVCKLCGEVKVFDNILADLMLSNDNSAFFGPDDVVGVEDAIEDNE